jgi:hypothetical protein
VGEPSDAKNQTCTLTIRLANATAFSAFGQPPADGRLFLLGEHVLQAFEDRENRLSLKLSERLHEALRINRPKLIERDEACAALKTASRTPWVRPPVVNCYLDGLALRSRKNAVRWNHETHPETQRHRDRLAGTR